MNGCFFIGLAGFVIKVLQCHLDPLNLATIQKTSQSVAGGWDLVQQKYVDRPHFNRPMPTEIQLASVLREAFTGGRVSDA